MKLKGIFRSKRTLLGLGAVLLVGTGGAYMGARYIVHQRTQGWKAAGIADSKAGHHEQAVDELSRFLRRYPGDEVALEYYIRSREQVELPNGQHLAETVNALKLLLRLDPTNIDEHRHLLELYVKLERLPESLDETKLILSKNPHDVRTLELQTHVLMEAGQYRDAILSATAWSAAAPADFHPYMERSTARVRVGQSKESILDEASQARAAHPDDPGFELMQGFAFAQNGDDTQAVQWFKTAANHPGLKDDLAKVLVAQFDSVGQSEDALKILQNLVHNGADPEIRYLLGRRLWETGAWQQAADALDIALDKPDSDATLIALKAVALSKLGKMPEYNACVQALSSRTSSSARAWTLLLPNIVEGKPIDDKTLVGQCRSALVMNPDNIYLGFYLGEASDRLGDKDFAINVWRAVVSQGPTWNVPAVRLVEALLQQGRADLALDAARSAVRRNHSAPVIIALSRAWAAAIESGDAGHEGDLLKLVDEVQKQIPGEEQTLLVRVQLLAPASKPDAVAAVRAALAQKTPPSEQVSLALAALSRRYGLGVEAPLFEASEKAHGLTPALAFSEALDALGAGSVDKGLQLFDELASRAGKSADLAWTLQRARYLDVSRNAKAAESWMALSDAYPADWSVQSAALNSSALRGNWDGLTRIISRVKALSGDDAFAWRLAEARLMVESPRTQGDIEQAAGHLNDILKSNQSLTEPHVLLALALVKMNRLDGAIDQLSAAARLDPGSLTIGLQLATLLQSRGDFDRARQQLDHVLPRIRSEDQRRQAAILLSRQGDPVHALQVLTPASGAPGQTAASGDDLLTAMLLAQSGQLSKAEGMLAKLLETPDLSTVNFASSFYAAQGRRADADKAIARLDSVKLDPGIKEMARGSCYAQMGDLAEAARQYQTAAKLVPTNPVAWRVLATCLMGLGKTDDAFAAVNEGLKSLPAEPSLLALRQNADLLRQSLADPGLRMLVLTTMRDPVGSDIAVQLLSTVADVRKDPDAEHMAARLQQFADAHANFLPAQIQLASCDWSMGRFNDALVVLERAISTFNTDAEPARVAVGYYAASGRFKDMQAAAEVWKKRSPTDASQADAALADAQIGLKQYDAALALLQPYVPAMTANPDRFDHQLVDWAVASANAGNAKAAADLLWPLTGKSANWRMHWVQVAMAIQDGPTAATWLDRIVPALPADAFDERAEVAAAYTDLGARLSDPQLATKSTYLFTQIAADPKADPQAILRAGLHCEHTADLATAESLYRRALIGDPKLWMAENNLALLVAQRGGDIQDAIRLATAAAQTQPRQATIHDTLAFLYAKNGDHNAAAEQLRIAVQLDPDNAKWHIRLAQNLLDAGNVVEAAKTVAVMDARQLDVRNLPAPMQLQLDAIRKQIKGKRT